MGMEFRKEIVSGWGRYTKSPCYLTRPEWPSEVQSMSLDTDFKTLIPRGLGRSYGDQSSNKESLVMLATRLDRFLEWDGKEGILHGESGASLDKVLKFAVPRGFFLPVTPGTRFITLGGALAFDVHGKNQHKDGNFGNHVIGFTLLLANGEKKWVSQEEDPELFKATIGGMGLTGIIMDVKFRLVPIESSHVVVKYAPFKSLEEARDIFLQGDKEFPFTVAWLDLSMEKGVATLGRFAGKDEVKAEDPLKVHPDKLKKVPGFFPTCAMNKLSLKLFYRLYYRMQAGRGIRIEEYDKFFYPLDAIENWNTLYGKKGFVQYQIVVPMEGGIEALRKVTGKLREKGHLPYLSVLKLFGNEKAGIMSFPREGYTLALDLPAKKKLFPVLDEIDRMVLDSGGRIYLAKDARMKPDTLKAMYPELEEWKRIKERVDPDCRFSSDLSRRLGIT